MLLLRSLLASLDHTDCDVTLYRPGLDPAQSHLCRGSEDTELQLWTDSSVEDFRGPSGEGSRLVLEADGDSRLLLTDEGNESLRQPGRTSALSVSVKPASEGRTRIGGTVRSPVAERLVLPQLAEPEKVP